MIYTKFIGCLILLFWTSYIHYCTSTVLIITTAYNRSDFILFQHETFKKFLKDEHKYVVFNDASNDTFKKEIDNTCKNLNIACITVPQDLHTKLINNDRRINPQFVSARHATAIEYALNTIGYDHDGIVAIIDNDMFLTRPFSIAEFMNDYPIASFYRQFYDITFLWPGLTFLKMNELPEKKNFVIQYNVYVQRVT